MGEHPDFGIQTRWFTIELSICQFRDGYWPAAYAGTNSVDLFVPLPGGRTLWVAVISWWLADYLGIDSFDSEALASTVPEPPYECEAEGCEFETKDYGTFLTHDVREQAYREVNDLHPATDLPYEEAGKHWHGDTLADFVVLELTDDEDDVAAQCERGVVLLERAIRDLKHVQSTLARKQREEGNGTDES